MTTEPEGLKAEIIKKIRTQPGENTTNPTDLNEMHGRRLWRALGFADPEGEVPFDDTDLWALGEVSELMKSTGFDFDTVMQMTRGVGSTVSRLAEWEVGILTSHLVEEFPSEERQKGALTMVRELGPRFERLLIYAWRKHLAAAVWRAPNIEGHNEELAEETVGFADMVSFSALTNELSDEEVGELVEEFESLAHDVVSEFRGRVIKALGDSVLFVAPSPDLGVQIAWALIDVVGSSPVLPDIRTGVVYGSVVKSMGDVYGPAVNLASRLTTVARRNRVITDLHTAEELPEEYRTKVLPGREVRGFGIIEPVSVSRRSRSRAGSDRDSRRHT